MPQTPAQKAANEKRRAYALSQKRGPRGRFLTGAELAQAQAAANTNANSPSTTPTNTSDPLDIPNLTQMSQNSSDSDVTTITDLPEIPNLTMPAEPTLGHVPHHNIVITDLPGSSKTHKDIEAKEEQIPDPVYAIEMPDEKPNQTTQEEPALAPEPKESVETKPQHEMPTHTIQHEYHPKEVLPTDDERKTEEHVILPHPEAGKKPGFFGKLKSLFS